MKSKLIKKGTAVVYMVRFEEKKVKHLHSFFLFLSECSNDVIKLNECSLILVLIDDDVNVHCPFLNQKQKLYTDIL